MSSKLKKWVKGGIYGSSSRTGRGLACNHFAGRRAAGAGSRVDVVYSLSADRYGPGEQGGALQLQVQDLAPSI
jgi:hypothetical protein